MKYWFRSKDYGWGWQPNTWQGWLVIFLWGAVFTYLYARFAASVDTMPDTAPEIPGLVSWFIAKVFFITSVLIFTCWAKGERPEWRWHGKKVAPKIIVQKTLMILLFILVAQSAGLIGIFFTMDAIPTWYAALAKPSFSPANWVFGPVWAILYTLMGLAAFFVWEVRATNPNAWHALRLYGTQLLLNAIWTPIFFGLKTLTIALVVMAVLLFVIVATIRAFWKVNPWLGVILLPYLAWVSFAGVLSFSIWQLN